MTFDNFLKDLFTLCVLLFCLHLCTCTACLPSAAEVQTRTFSSLEEKFQIVVNFHIGAEN